MPMLRSPLPPRDELPLPCSAAKLPYRSPPWNPNVKRNAPFLADDNHALMGPIARRPRVLHSPSGDVEAHWQRGALQRNKVSWGTTCARQPDTISLHRFLSFETYERLPENPRCPFMGRHGDAVMHPLPVTPDRNNPRPPQIREMARDLWLRTPDDLNQIADAKLLVTHQVQDSQPGFVCQRLKEARKFEWGFLCHAYIFALTNVFVKNIFSLANMS
jgi:hypothetical protein